MSFYKKYEVYSPDDLCWLEVTLNLSDKSVTIDDVNKPGPPILICDGKNRHQLQQIIDILTHIRGPEVSPK